MSLPSLPVLEGDLALEVFTHDSIRHEAMTGHPVYGDKRRLIFVGQFALRHAVTLAYFHIEPLLTEDQIKVTDKFRKNIHLCTSYYVIDSVAIKPFLVTKM